MTFSVSILATHDIVGLCDLGAEPSTNTGGHSTWLRPGTSCDSGPFLPMRRAAPGLALLGAGGSSAPSLVPGLQSPGSWRFQPTPADSWPHTPHLLGPSGSGTPPDTGLPPHRGPVKKKDITSQALCVMQEVGRASPCLAESDFINTSLPW